MEICDESIIIWNDTKRYKAIQRDIRRCRRMLEGCVTAVYAGATLLLAGLFVAASLGGWRARLAAVDSLWRLLLALACGVYAAAMALSLEAKACAGWGRGG